VSEWKRVVLQVQKESGQRREQTEKEERRGGEDLERGQGVARVVTRYHS